ncbi:centrosomal protein of 295 kDa [Oncorhynchus kisutch]|uniref:centrosomal protein of 295 kDa n=1 Tax=Oncorhynchus kisutch TaxID=8019 RepID=UPI0009A000AA|nr:centrosomal protein of 295 kDa [Oncorhynchus kisutch]
MPETTVDREVDTAQPKAWEVAKEEVWCLQELGQEELRGNHVLRRERLTQIFQLLSKRQEMREDWQRDMEFTFEDMYTGERRVKCDLVLQLVPEPLPAVSTGRQDLDLEEATPDLTPSAGAEEQLDEEPSRPLGGAPRKALKKLLTCVRSQRDQWGYRRLVDPRSDCQTI